MKNTEKFIGAESIDYITDIYNKNLLTVDEVNSSKIVVNNLNFNEKHMTNKLIGGIDFDISVFNNTEKEKEYNKIKFNRMKRWLEKKNS